MKIVCAWCGKDMGEKEPYEDKGTTHEMCGKCQEEQSSIRWQCNFCPEIFPHYKALVEHYDTAHHQELRRFHIVHKASKASGITMATNSEQACEFFGWNSQECGIKVIE